MTEKQKQIIKSLLTNENIRKSIQIDNLDNLNNYQAGLLIKFLLTLIPRRNRRRQ